MLLTCCRDFIAPFRLSTSTSWWQTLDENENIYSKLNQIPGDCALHLYTYHILTPFSAFPSGTCLFSFRWWTEPHTYTHHNTVHQFPYWLRLWCTRCVPDSHFDLNWLVRAKSKDRYSKIKIEKSKELPQYIYSVSICLTGKINAFNGVCQQCSCFVRVLHVFFSLNQQKSANALWALSLSAPLPFLSPRFTARF